MRTAGGKASMASPPGRQQSPQRRGIETWRDADGAAARQDQSSAAPSLFGSSATTCTGTNAAGSALPLVEYLPPA